MSLPQGFVFSQGSFQAYVDCPRLFQLHYVLNKAWPAPVVEPQLEGEVQRERGRAFHQLLHQHAHGVPASILSDLELDDDVRRWWNNYLQSPPPDVPDAMVRSEFGLSAPIGDYRLSARYDRVGAEPEGRIVVVDWKTGTKLPKRPWLEQRMQTRVYPYVMTLAGFALNGGAAPKPEQVEMVYWYANFPNRPVRFSYDRDRFESDGAYLNRLVDEIAARGEGDWELTGRPSRCPFCSYRSLCKRGTEAASLTEWEDDGPDPDGEWDFDLKLEQIAEVVF